MIILNDEHKKTSLDFVHNYNILIDAFIYRLAQLKLSEDSLKISDIKNRQEQLPLFIKRGVLTQCLENLYDQLTLENEEFVYALKQERKD